MQHLGFAPLGTELPAQGKAALRDSPPTPLPLQAPAGQGTQRSSGELKCGREVPGPSLMKQFTVLAEIVPELFRCLAHGQRLPVDPSPMQHLRLQGPHDRRSTRLPQAARESIPQPTQGALGTNLPSSRSLRGPYLSMTIPRGSVMALSRKDPMVKAKFSISSWALQEGHLCSGAVPFSWAGLLVALPTWDDTGSSSC